MKKTIMLCMVCCLVWGSNAWSGERMNHLASVTIDTLITYYASLENIPAYKKTADREILKNKVAFIRKNRQALISLITTNNGCQKIGAVQRIIEHCYKNRGAQLAAADRKAMCPAYFDARTGHKYIRSGENTYSEFSKKGKFLKKVNADLPLLVNSRHIHPISEETYILYEKRIHGTKEFKSYPALEKHPSGWRASRLMLSLN